MNTLLADKGITPRSETLVDVTIIDAPSSTKNKAGARKVMRGASKGGELHPVDAQINRIIAMVEHPFRVMKRQFGHVNTRYRGLAKNRAQLFILFALGNLYLLRRKLMA